MRKIRLYLSTITVICGLLLLGASTSAQGAPLGQSTSQTEIEQAIWDAILVEVPSSPEAFLFDAYDWEISQITFSDDRSSAVVWLDPMDPLTGMTLATEPMVVIVELIPDKPASESSSWTVSFPSDTEKSVQAAQVTSLLPQELIEPPRSSVLDAPQAPLVALGGYKLPWAAGATKSLIWSAEHTSCIPITDCIYAFDFADGTMFPLLAAKGGTVFYAYDDYANNDNTCHTDTTPCHYHTNKLIIKDISTSPTSYQLYWHLAQNTIPAALHTIGAPVMQGQYIGNTDNTGASSGHHLHFMVHTSPYGYWGTAVDITFRDVSINWDAATLGGRPRTQAGAAILGGQWQTSYTSGNVGANPPTGGLTLPGDKQIVLDHTLATSGWGSDNLGVTRLRLIAYFDESWNEVGEAQTATPFNYDLDVCSAHIPAGPFDLALRVWDVEGNQSQLPLGTRHLVNGVDCPDQVDPVCNPDSYQAAIYSGVNFAGSCKRLGIGTHTPSQILPVISNDTASVILGDNVQIRMYDGDNLNDRRETLTNSDRNLVDNPIDINHLSSVSIQPRTTLPVLNLFVDGSYDPHGPSSADPTAVDSITVAWWADGATKYKTRIFSGTLPSKDGCEASGYLVERLPEWTIQPTWSIGTLPAGNYTWCVRGRISDKSNNLFYSDWEMEHFLVTTGSLTTPATRSLPFIDDGESGMNDWTPSGLWRLIADSVNPSDHIWACNNIDNDIGDGTYGGGDLTSPPIQIPNEGATLHFNYRYETESDQIFWDQRWVQISQNGGRFQNLIQLSDDSMNTWLASPVIDLTSYANSTIRIRFHFSTTDKYYNGDLEGWLVDDISLMMRTLEGCEESIPDSLITATPINYGDELAGTICPAGDVDFYKFTATKGDKLIALVKAKQLSPASQLNSYLTVLDQDQYGNSPIAENDDMQTGEMTDSQIYFIAPEDGTYYLKVKSNDHPSSGGTAFNYTVTLTKQPAVTDTTAPNLAITFPLNNTGIHTELTALTASATDTESGVSLVDFWVHSPDWTSGTWALLTSDAYGADGWQAFLDGTEYQEGQAIALVVMATDWAGNTSTTVNWNIPFDNTPPVTALNPLPLQINGNGIFLSWAASDLYGFITQLDFFGQRDSEGWIPLTPDVPNGRNGAWIIEAPGHDYSFWMRGVDSAGNEEDDPVIPEVTTTLSGTCTPDPYDQVPGGDSLAVFASNLLLETVQTHNYCEINDVDWISFDGIQTGQLYLISVRPDSASPMGSSIDIYQQDEGSWLQHWDAPDMLSPLRVLWEAPADGRFLIKISPILSGIMGDNTTYTVRVGVANLLYFPAIYAP